MAESMIELAVEALVERLEQLPHEIGVHQSISCLVASIAFDHGVTPLDLSDAFRGRTIFTRYEHEQNH